jgi:hypothetical protein
MMFAVMHKRIKPFLIAGGLIMSAPIPKPLSRSPKERAEKGLAPEFMVEDSLTLPLALIGLSLTILFVATVIW